MVVEFRVSDIGFDQTDMRCEHGRYHSASNEGSNVVVLDGTKFLEADVLVQWIAVRRRPVGTPLTASPCYACIYSRDCVLNQKWIQDFSSSFNREPWGISQLARTPLFEGGPLAVKVFERCSYVSHIERPKQNVFPAYSISLVPGRPMGFRGVWAPDSCSPHRITPRTIMAPHTWYPCR
jgi:hypothetical protein